VVGEAEVPAHNFCRKLWGQRGIECPGEKTLLREQVGKTCLSDSASLLGVSPLHHYAAVALLFPQFHNREYLPRAVCCTDVTCGAAVTAVTAALRLL